MRLVNYKQILSAMPLCLADMLEDRLWHDDLKMQEPQLKQLQQSGTIEFLPEQLSSEDPRLWQGTSNRMAWDTRDGILFEPKALLQVTYEDEAKTRRELTRELQEDPLVKPLFEGFLMQKAKAAKACKGVLGESAPLQGHRPAS